LSPGEIVLPLEFYVFTNDTDWVVYKEVMSDIFDYILAVVPEFGPSNLPNSVGTRYEKLALDGAVLKGCPETFFL
jgi:miniconductance mechanosensitive channel